MVLEFETQVARRLDIRLDLGVDDKRVLRLMFYKRPHSTAGNPSEASSHQCLEPNIELHFFLKVTTESHDLYHQVSGTYIRGTPRNQCPQAIGNVGGMVEVSNGRIKG